MNKLNTQNIYNFLVQVLKVDHFHLSPGLRCLPFYERIHHNQGSFSIHLDERQNAFQALGRLKAGSAPQVIACTSGTAGAHFYPALIEAYYSNLTLIAITCDRPKRLRGSEDNQTINQIDLFFPYAKTINIECSEELDWQLIENDLQQIVKESRGPIHINLSYDEPLYDESKLGKEKDWKEISKETKGTTIDLSSYDNPFLMIGSLSFGEQKAMAEFLEQYKGPFYLDISSGLYNKVQINQCAQLENKELQFIFENFDQIIHIGGKILSQNYYRFLDNHSEMKEVWLSSHLPEKIISNRVIATCETSFDSILKSLSSLPNFEKKKFNQFCIENAKCYSNLDYGQNSHFSFIHHFLNHEERGYLVLGNSTPIRVFNEYPERQKGLKTITQRGASGIDGLISLSKGVAKEHPYQNVFLVLGDISAYHDFSSLFNDQPTNLKIFILNNNRGGIFSRVNNYKVAPFDPYIETPHKMSFDQILKGQSFYFGLIEARDKYGLSRFLRSNFFVAEVMINHEIDLKELDKLR